MQLVKNAQQKLYSILMMALAAILLSACSDDSVAVSTDEQQVEVTKEEEKEIKSETAEEMVLETKLLDEDQTTEEAQEEPAVSSFAEETLTLDEFINLWNEIEPGRLSGETKTMSVENGILTGLGYLGSGDSYIFELDQKDNMINKVSLNLSYPLSEEGGGIGNNIPYNISILMNVLEPELREEKKEEMLSTLLSSQILEVSVREGKVTYTVRNGDDRFWLDATLY